MNMGSWRLLSQGIGINPLVGNLKIFMGRRIVESKFIINCNFCILFLCGGGGDMKIDISQ